jgi:hypothetical protein
MSNENRVAIIFTDEQKANIENAFKVLEETILPQMITLSVAERRALPKLKDKSTPLVQKTLDYTDSESRFVPSYMDPAAAKPDYAAFNLLNAYINRTLRFLGPMQEHAPAVRRGDPAGGFAILQQRQTVRKEIVSGAREVYEDLKVRFEKSKSAESAATETTT